MTRFVQIAMGSAAELSYHLLLSKDLGMLGPEEYARLTSELDAAMRMLSALSGRLKGTERRNVVELKAQSS